MFREKNGRSYDGAWLVSQREDGIKDGLGSMGFITGARYEGMWSQGRMHGKGLYIWADGRRYEGEWVAIKIRDCVFSYATDATVGYEAEREKRTNTS